MESSTTAGNASTRYYAATSLGSVEDPSFAAAVGSGLGEASINLRVAMHSERSMAAASESETTTMHGPRQGWIQRVY